MIVGEDMIRVSAPHFCAAVIVGNGKIQSAAPILAWMLGREFSWFLGYCQSRDWGVSLVETGAESL